MKFSYDPAKSERNVAERGLPFHLAAEFEWGLALILRDGRKDYGEHRYLALGSIGERLHVLVFTLRGDTVHSDQPAQGEPTRNEALCHTSRTRN